MNEKSLGSLLRDWRIECNLTQEELGAAAGLSRKIVGNIERGERKVDTKEVVRFCRALGRNAEDLVLYWSRSFVEELRKVELEMQDSQEIGQPDKSHSGAPDGTASGSIHEIVAKIAVLIQEIIHAAQAELIQKLQLEMNLSGASSPPPPAAPRRARSRVSRRGRAASRGPA